MARAAPRRTDYGQVPQPEGATRTGDVYEIYVRHDVGVEVYLSSKDIDLPDDPQFAAPTANYFMGMYEAH